VVGPIYVAQLALISIIIYRLTKTDLSQDEKKKISYAELPISLVASISSLWMYGIFLFSLLSSIFSYFSIYTIYLCLLFLLFTPFTFTVLRVALDNKLSEEQKLVLSVVTIPLTIFTAWSTTILAIGGH
jgi:hypothetical protein